MNYLLMHIVKGYFVAGLFAVLIGCSSLHGTFGDNKLGASFPERPAWLLYEPEAQGDDFLFVGLSNKLATEKDAREDAQRSAINNAVKYISTDVKSNFERMLTSSGLSTEIIDPTVMVRGFEQQFSSAVTRRFKPKEWYLETWETKKTKEVYYIAYLLAKISQQEVNNAIKEQKEKQQELIAKSRAAIENITKAKQSIQEGDILKDTDIVRSLNYYRDALKTAGDAKLLLSSYLDKTPVLIDETIKSAEDRINNVRQNPEASFNMGIAGLIKPSEKPINIVVAKASYQDTDLSSELGNYLIQKLEGVLGKNRELCNIIVQNKFQDELKRSRISIEDCVNGNFNKLDSTNTIQKINGLIFAHYWEKENNIEVKIDLIGIGNGVLMGTTTVDLAKSSIPPTINLYPANANIAYQGLNAFSSRLDKNKDFKIKVWSDKGEGAIYKKDEVVKFCFRSNKNCYVYIYHMDAGGQVKMLFPNGYNKNNSINENQVYVIPDQTMKFDLQIGEPFGVEIIKAIASLQPLKDSDIKPGENGFREIGKVTDGNLKELINHSFESIPKEFYTEDTCIITTIQ
jgi:hypothetical protein